MRNHLWRCGAHETDRYSPLLFLELNEVNFDFLRAYADGGQLPTFKALLDAARLRRSPTSEQKYEELEPWIQWVTAHTGMTLAEHGVFRLGDIVKHDIPQIWEQLEQRGLRVGAISPMNAKNRLRDPAFFVPDPWTATADHGAARPRGAVRGDRAGRQRQRAVEGFGRVSLIDLLRGLPPMRARELAHATCGSRLTMRVIRGARRCCSTCCWRTCSCAKCGGRGRISRALFLNAAAHIQHHYLFCSLGRIEGRIAIPSGTCRRAWIPCSRCTRSTIASSASVMAAFPDARVMLATGLHQDPHESVTFYWRLRDHAAFLRESASPSRAVEPRMSRDFLISFESEAAALAAQALLESARSPGMGIALFDVDNRGRDVFAMLTYPRDIDEDAVFQVAGRTHAGLRDRVSFVALKNGEHDGMGYFIDTGRRLQPDDSPIRLASMPELIIEALFGPNGLSRA